MKTPLDIVIPHSEVAMQVAQIVPCTEAEGPGKRFAIWFQGCPLRCPGCCNPEFLPFRGGETSTTTQMMEQISQAQRDTGIEGISLLGGEPFAHATAAAVIARESRKRGLSVMIYSGYTLNELSAKPEPEIADLLSEADLLVDGPYIREQPDTTRRWIGSTNQQIRFLTNRYHADDPCWQQHNTLEIRVQGKDITINGFPALTAAGLWKGWKRKR